MQDFRNLIVIGASAGGIPAITKVLSGFSDKIDAAILVVLHVSRKSDSNVLATIFQKHTSLQCGIATDGTKVRKGHVYVAPPEHQLMIKENFLVVSTGTHENKYRPSIDVLFRSAAVTYGNRTIGIVLTGLLEDGTSGMSAIKRSGGICIIQDPSEAQYSDMPRSVRNKIKVDHQARLDDIPGIVLSVISAPLPPETEIPTELRIEADITEKMMSSIDDLKKIADHSDFVCPDCGGGLWAVKNDPLHRYRCHTGHVYTERLLHDIQDDNIEESIWISIRMLEEKRNLLLLMSQHENEDGEQEISAGYRKRVNETTRHINTLKSFLAKLTEDLQDAQPKPEV
ncbi:MAG TPA: chemotaxis protein CheB [Flavobacterium sp.]|jgi:two-component system chemotaxis response regulator CheB